MILSKLDFIENIDKDNYWEIKNLNFGMFNLIVGLNATGKTRLINVISNLAKLLSQKTSRNANCAGDWKLEFLKKGNIKFKYHLSTEKDKVLYEEIKEGRRVLLKRQGDKGDIYSVTKEKKITINPPANELIINVRRDIKEFPYLEDIFEWANNFLGYKFTSARPDELIVPITIEQKDIIENLGAIPLILKRAVDEDEEIITDFEEDDVDDGDEEMDNIDSDEIDNLEYKTFRYDLCCKCHSRYLQDPLSIKSIRRGRFSEN